MRDRPTNIIGYEQKWVYEYRGTGKGVPIEKVQKELEKRGYKITIENELMRIEKKSDYYQKFSLRIHEEKEVYCYNYLNIIEYKWELGEILDQLGIIDCRAKQEDDYSRPIYKSYASIC